MSTGSASYDRGSARTSAREAVRDFLTTRRARVSPAEAGLVDSGRRRVPGLRREEVALLAGISAEYYAKLERGDAGGPSESVRAALARVLRLDEVERAHLDELFRNLARGAGGGPGAAAEPAPGEPESVRPELLDLLDLLAPAAAFLRNGRLDVVAANAPARSLYGALWSAGRAVPNLARYVFTDPRSRDFYGDWARQAAAAVGSLRAEAARSPGDATLAALVADLGAVSADFRSLWASHDVDYYRTGTQRFRHPRAGDLELRYEALEVAADPGLTLLVYAGAPGSADAAALATLDLPTRA